MFDATNKDAHADAFASDAERRDLTVIVAVPGDEQSECVWQAALQAASADSENRYLFCVLEADGQAPKENEGKPENIKVYRNSRATMRDIAYQAELMTLEHQLHGSKPLAGVFIDRFQLLHLEITPDDQPEPSTSELIEKVEQIVDRMWELVEDRQLDVFVVYGAEDACDITPGIALMPPALNAKATRVIGIMAGEDGAIDMELFRDETRVLVKQDEAAQPLFEEPSLICEERTVPASKPIQGQEASSGDLPVDTEPLEALLGYTQAALDSINASGSLTGPSLIKANLVSAQILHVEDTCFASVFDYRQKLDDELYSAQAEGKAAAVTDTLGELYSETARLLRENGVDAKDYAPVKPESASAKPVPSWRAATAAAENEPAPKRRTQTKPPAAKNIGAPGDGASSPRNANRVLVEYEEDFDYMKDIKLHDKNTLRTGAEGDGGKLRNIAAEIKLAPELADGKAIGKALENTLENDKLEDERHVSVYMKDPDADELHELKDKSDVKKAAQKAQSAIDDGHPDDVVVWVSIALTGSAALTLLLMLLKGFKKSKKQKGSSKSRKGKKRK